MIGVAEVCAHYLAQAPGLCEDWQTRRTDGARCDGVRGVRWARCVEVEAARCVPVPRRVRRASLRRAISESAARTRAGLLAVGVRVLLRPCVDAWVNVALAAESWLDGAIYREAVYQELARCGVTVIDEREV